MSFKERYSLFQTRQDKIVAEFENRLGSCLCKKKDCKPILVSRFNGLYKIVSPCGIDFGEHRYGNHQTGWMIKMQLAEQYDDFLAESKQQLKRLVEDWNQLKSPRKVHKTRVELEQLSFI